MLLDLVAPVILIILASSAAAQLGGPEPACKNQPRGASTVARINCGGPAVEYPAGCSWAADDATNPYPNITSGADRIEASSVCSTASNPGGPLACSMRWSGPPINYTFPATWGQSYLIIVQLSEVYFTAAGKRSVDIIINGVTQFRDIDPFAAGEGRFVPSLYSSTVDFQPDLAQGVPTGGYNLTVGVIATKDFPCVSAIEVYDVTGLSTGRRAVSSAIIGGVVGAVGGALLVGVLVYILRRRKRKRDSTQP